MPSILWGRKQINTPMNFCILFYPWWSFGWSKTINLSLAFASALPGTQWIADFENISYSTALSGLGGLRERSSRQKALLHPIFLSLLLCEVKSQLNFANNLFDFRSGESPPEMIIYKCVKNGPILASGTRSITLLMRHQSSFVWDIFPPYFAVDSLRRWRSSGATGNICIPPCIYSFAFILLLSVTSLMMLQKWEHWGWGKMCISRGFCEVAALAKHWNFLNWLLPSVHPCLSL